ncbi:hypothetical protein [Thalassobacillus devorans]|uniref:hypothetical protein n=1 Tax=Thalassobacillus devorans TaxID=279813 RepID=UPI00048D60E8|nr:hypothetical protein [Thalassobacillus devorans]
MNKKRLMLYGLIASLLISSGFVYYKITDDTYEGMSIIPEQHKDIPVYQGLKPTKSNYVSLGNQWTEIYNFYLKELPELGWEVEHADSALDDNNSKNDWSGFHSRWRKEGFDGELWISASYSQFENYTEVTFDKTPLRDSIASTEEAKTRDRSD